MRHKGRYAHEVSIIAVMIGKPPMSRRFLPFNACNPCMMLLVFSNQYSSFATKKCTHPAIQSSGLSTAACRLFILLTLHL